MKRAVTGINNLPDDFMSIETIGEAPSLGWRVVARCVYSRADGPSSKSSRECIYRKELDMPPAKSANAILFDERRRIMSKSRFRKS